ncbi:MAG: lytic transglycosylase domain-containing protein [Salinivirgaceae bacterium]|nr:lytic transglycosylase domain-containing protein [Salinivirgaceae bacterium]MDD4745682.1 lytic transglycosylase domain-containing protein [Salinivirgaceae bacterium]MDY0279646.1 lytic transglycosylase domain-containing protein [Salinivirgaceae bacterium]
MRKLVITLVTVALFLGVLGIVKFSFILKPSKSNEIEYEEENRNQKFQKVSSVPMPSQISFAGEKVPMENFDIRERLERELVVNVFWHSSTYINIKKANRYLPHISQILKEEGLPDDLKYIPLIESGLTNAISPSKAVGFWQFLSGTAKEYGLEINNEVDERYHWKKSTIAACKFFKWLNNRFDSWTLSTAAYNCGRTTVIRQMDQQKQSDYYSLLFSEETERYVFRAIAFKLILNNPERYGFYLEYDQLYPAISTKEIVVNETISNLADWAKERGLTYRELKYFNPWLRANTLTISKNKEYIIEIPTKKYQTRFTHLIQ